MRLFRVSWIAMLLISPAAVRAQVPLFQWAAEPEVATGNSIAYGVALDASGNSIVCGMFLDTLTLSTGAIRATGNTIPNNADVFVVKYSPSGAVVWGRNGGNASLGSLESGYGVAVDASANIYVTGEYGGSTPTSFGGIQIAASGGGAFVVKYDPDGTVLWAKSVTTSAYGIAIATSGASNVYVLVGGVPTEIKKLDASNGAVLDTWSFPGLSPDPDMHITADASGNVVFSGTFFNTVDFDPGAGVSNLVGDVNGDGFIARYDGSGALLWARQLSGGGRESIRNHAVDATGGIYFSGGMDGTATIDTVTAGSGTVAGKLNSSGRALWMRNLTSQFLGSDLTLGVERIGVDGTGDYYITGIGLAGGGTIGTFTIPPGQHFHVVRYDPAGAVVYAKFVPVSSGFILPRGFAVHGADLYQVVGDMSDEGTFDTFTLPDINGPTRQAPFIGVVGDVTSPVLASLATAEATPDRVRITWYVTGLEGNARVERRRGADEWLLIGEAVRSGPDYLVYEDRDVAPGERLTYRLVWVEGGVELHSDPVQIVVPSGIGRLELAAAPNPANGLIDARIALPVAGDATLALHDILGREVMTRNVRADAAGRMIVRLGTADLPAGLYWLSLRQGGAAARTRVSVVR